MQNIPFSDQGHRYASSNADVADASFAGSAGSMADTAFVNTAHIHRGDTSVDTSEDIHRQTETDDVRRTFGELGELLLCRRSPHPTSQVQH